jgi:hypothetical protein
MAIEPTIATLGVLSLNLKRAYIRKRRNDGLVACPLLPANSSGVAIVVASVGGTWSWV